MKSVILADSNILFSQGLSLILEQESNFSVAAITTSENELEGLLKSHIPDLLILNPELSEKINLKNLKNFSSATKILLIAEADSLKSIEPILGTEIDGLLANTANKNELCFALNSLLSGQTYLSPSIYRKILEHKNKRASKLASLSKREQEVLKLLAQGLKNKEVAKTLHISTRTIDSHRAHIMKKLDIRSNAEMIRLALEEGLLES